MGKRYNKDGEEIETRREVFMRNYKNVPGFKAVIKLGVYLILILILVIMAAVINLSKKEEETKNRATAKITEPTTVQLTFNEILDNISKIGSTNKISIKYQDKEYMITSTIKDDYIEGYYESTDLNTKFKIKDNKVYELKMNNEVLNDELFYFLDVDFINNNELIKIMKETISTKELDDGKIIYNFDINKDDMDSYKMKAIISNNKIENISIINDIIEYSIIME